MPYYSHDPLIIFLKKAFVTIVLIVGSQNAISAQNFEWKVDAKYLSLGNNMVLNQDSSSLLCGMNTTGNTRIPGVDDTFDLSLNTGSNVAMYSQTLDGEIEWAKSWNFGSTFNGQYSIKQVLNVGDHYYVMGRFIDSLIENSTDSLLLLCGLNFDILGNGFLLKLDSNLDHVWALAFERTGLLKVDVNSKGEVKLLAKGTGSSDLDPGPDTLHPPPGAIAYILNISKDGELEDPWYFDTTDPFDIHIDKEDNLYFGASISQDMDVDPDTTFYYARATQNRVGILVKYDSTNQFEWVREFGSNIITDIDISTTNSDIIFSANFQSFLNFDSLGTSKTYNSYSLNTYANALIFLNKNGTFKKGATITGYGSLLLHKTSIDNNGNVYIVCGYYQGAFVGLNNTGPILLNNKPHGLGSGGTFMAMYDSTLNLDWHINYTTATPLNNSTAILNYDLAIDPNNNIFIKGRNPSGVLDINPSVSPVIIPQYHNFVMKLGSCEQAVETLDSTFCDRDSSYYSDAIFFEGYTYLTDTFNTSNCDSIVVRRYQLYNSKSTDIDVYACDTFRFDSIVLNQDTTITQVYSGVNSCDSIVNTNLHFSYTYRDTTVYNSCDSLYLTNTMYYADTVFIDSINSGPLCDSIYYSKISITPADIEYRYIDTCSTSWIAQHGNTDSSTFKIDTISSAYPVCSKIIYYKAVLVEPTYTLMQDDSILTASDQTASYKWMRCSDSSIVNGENSYQFILQDTNYYALIIDQKGCVDTTECFNYNTASIDELILLGIKVYPNPFKDVLTIECSELTSIEILDQQAKLLFKTANSNQLDIDLSSLAAGVYTLKLQQRDRAAYKKLIKY